MCAVIILDGKAKEPGGHETGRVQRDFEDVMAGLWKLQTSSGTTQWDHTHTLASNLVGHVTHKKHNGPDQPKKTKQVLFFLAVLNLDKLKAILQFCNFLSLTVKLTEIFAAYLFLHASEA